MYRPITAPVRTIGSAMGRAMATQIAPSIANNRMPAPTRTTVTAATRSVAASERGRSRLRTNAPLAPITNGMPRKTGPPYIRSTRVEMATSPRPTASATPSEASTLRTDAGPTVCGSRDCRRGREGAAPSASMTA